MWWWALAWMLSHHPDYSTDWTALCHSRGSAEFQKLMNTMQQRYGRRLDSDWLLFADSVCEQFDPQRSFAIYLEDGTARPDRLTLTADAPVEACRQIHRGDLGGDRLGHRSEITPDQVGWCRAARSRSRSARPTPCATPSGPIATWRPARPVAPRPGPAGPTGPPSVSTYCL